MGFAIVRGGVAMALECLGQGDLLVRQSGQLFPVMQQLVIPLGPPTEPLRQVSPSRILPGQNAGAARRADMTGSISIGEKYALLRQLIDGRGFMELAAVAADVPLPQIIDEKEYDVGFPFFLGAEGEVSRQ